MEEDDQTERNDAWSANTSARVEAPSHAVRTGGGDPIEGDHTQTTGGLSLLSVTPARRFAGPLAAGPPPPPPAPGRPRAAPAGGRRGHGRATSPLRGAPACSVARRAGSRSSATLSPVRWLDCFSPRGVSQ